MNCIFCKIAKDEIPSYKVWEDENYLAMLDIHPVKKGHTLLIPKKHEPYVFGMENSDLQEIMLKAKLVSEILKRAFNPKSEKIGLIAYGLDVDHTHLHLIPLDKPGDLSFSNAKSAPKKDLEETLNRIKLVL